MRRVGVVRSVAVAVAVTTVIATPADAQVHEELALEMGPWSASGEASGTATASERGVTITWQGSIPAQFEFEISRTDDDAPGVATGTWEHQGAAVMTVTVSGVSAVGDLAFNGGGRVSGTDTSLQLSGDATTTGVVSAGPMQLPVSNSSELPPLPLNVRAVSCDEAYGDWVFTVEQAFEDQGFTASFSGFWIAFRQTSETQGEVAAILDTFGGSSNGDVSDIESRSELVALSSTLLSEYNAFVDAFPGGWTTARVLDVAARTEALLNAWRNLTECDERLIGPDNVETYVNGLTLVVQGLIVGGAGGVASSAWEQLAHLGARTGAFGPGASNPAEAVRAEQALIDAGEAILEANVDPADGEVFVNDDTERVMATGAAMGWDYSVNGEFLDARDTYDTTFGSPAPPIDGAEPDG